MSFKSLITYVTVYLSRPWKQCWMREYGVPHPRHVIIKVPLSKLFLLLGPQNSFSSHVSYNQVPWKTPCYLPSPKRAIVCFVNNRSVVSITHCEMFFFFNFKKRFYQKYLMAKFHNLSPFELAYFPGEFKIVLFSLRFSFLFFVGQVRRLFLKWEN